MSLRVLVFGGRDFAQRDVLFAALDKVHRMRGVACVIEGEAAGADLLAREWAESRGVPVEPYPADWQNTTAPGAIVRKRRDGALYNARAGHDRNRRMATEGCPDCGVQFPGGVGTADMREQLNRAGVPVWEPLGK